MKYSTSAHWMQFSALHFHKGSSDQMSDRWASTLMPLGVLWIFHTFSWNSFSVYRLSFSFQIARRVRGRIGCFQEGFWPVRFSIPHVETSGGVPPETSLDLRCQSCHLSCVNHPGLRSPLTGGGDGWAIGEMEWRVARRDRGDEETVSIGEENKEDDNHLNTHPHTHFALKYPTPQHLGQMTPRGTSVLNHHQWLKVPPRP